MATNERQYFGLQDSDQWGIWIDPDKEKHLRQLGFDLKFGDRIAAYDEEFTFDVVVLGRAEDTSLRFGLVFKHAHGELVTTAWPKRMFK